MWLVAASYILLGQYHFFLQHIWHRYIRYSRVPRIREIRCFAPLKRNSLPGTNPLYTLGICCVQLSTKSSWCFDPSWLWPGAFTLHWDLQLNIRQEIGHWVKCCVQCWVLRVKQISIITIPGVVLSFYMSFWLQILRASMGFKTFLCCRLPVYISLRILYRMTRRTGPFVYGRPFESELVMWTFRCDSSLTHWRFVVCRFYWINCDCHCDCDCVYIYQCIIYLWIFFLTTEIVRWSWIIEIISAYFRNHLFSSFPNLFGATWICFFFSPCLTGTTWTWGKSEALFLGWTGELNCCVPAIIIRLCWTWFASPSQIPATTTISTMRRRTQWFSRPWRSRTLFCMVWFRLSLTTFIRVLDVRQLKESATIARACCSGVFVKPIGIPMSIT